jgi:HEPN domain-containing protein
LPPPNNPIRTDKPFTVFSIEADHDYLLARMISFLGGGFHARAGYFAQQACEKYLKALSVQHDGMYLETHKLLELAAFGETRYPFLGHQAAKDDLARFDMFDQVGRYGGVAKYDPLSKGKQVADLKVDVGPGVLIAGAWIWTPRHLRYLDQVVVNMRRRLDFGKANFVDTLQAIMEDDQKSFFVATWRGPIPLKEVLTRDNFYFRPLESNPDQQR